MRYLLGAVPAAAIICARNRPVLVGALVAVSLVGVWHWYEDSDAKDDWRAAAAWVAAEVEPTDGIVFAPDYLRSAFGYYARVGEPLWPPLEWSESDLRHGQPNPAAFAAVGRVWLVEAHAVYLPPEIEAALGGFQPAETRSYPGPETLRVTLLVRLAEPAP